jgi:hypothetical protein
MKIRRYYLVFSLSLFSLSQYFALFLINGRINLANLFSGKFKLSFFLESGNIRGQQERNQLKKTKDTVDLLFFDQLPWQKFLASFLKARNFITQDVRFGNLRDLPSPCKVFQVFARTIISKIKQKNAVSSHKTQDILQDQSRVSINFFYD